MSSYHVHCRVKKRDDWGYWWGVWQGLTLVGWNGYYRSSQECIPLMNQCADKARRQQMPEVICHNEDIVPHEHERRRALSIICGLEEVDNQ